jgi:ribonuclease-3
MNLKPLRTRTNLLKPSKNNFGALSPDRKRKLAVFQKTAGFKFKDTNLLNIAFLHRSVSNEVLQGNQYNKINNERLEFLGDSVLGAVCATLLFRKYSEKNEGELAKIKSVVVSEDILSGIARELQIDDMLLLGKGEDLSGGRTKKAILADALEALIGALYLDSGYEAVFKFVSSCILPEIERVTEKNYHKDYKSLLQEYCQRMFRSYPEYLMVKRSGPEHERIFWIEVRVNGTSYGPGTGRNKKNAEQEAARMACEQLLV